MRILCDSSLASDVTMKKVVLFKSESEEWRRAFSDLEYEPVFVEPLRFKLTNLAELERKLAATGGGYRGIVLTSPRAIDALAECWHPAHIPIWTNKKVYTVGETSANKIRQSLGLECRGTASGNAENLGKIIVNENPESSKFLFPCGNLRSESIIEALQSKGLTVDAVCVYETSENENLKKSLMELNESASPCCMVFFSPSGCEYVHRQLQTFNNKLSQLPHFAIGSSTALKIVNLGVDIAGVALRPMPDSMVESVHKYFSELESHS